MWEVQRQARPCGVAQGRHRLTLPEEDVTHGSVDIVVDGVSAVDHQTIHKLHGLGSLATELPRHHHFTALGSTLHDEAEDAVTCPEEEEEGHERCTGVPQLTTSETSRPPVPSYPTAGPFSDKCLKLIQ